MTEINQKINDALSKLCKSEEHTLFVHDLYDETIFYDNATQVLDNTMIEKGLIRVDKEVRMLTSFGLEVCELGGWFKHLERVEKAKKEKEVLDQLNVESLKSTIKMNRWNKIFLIINAVLVVINLILMIYLV